MAKDMDLPTPARRAVNFDDPYARALAIVQQEMVAMPRRKTSTAQERALNQTYRRCVERLAEDVTAQRLVRRYRLMGFYTQASVRVPDPKRPGRRMPCIAMAPATAQEAESQVLEWRKERLKWRVQRKRLN